jgi:hypothetical protein
LQLVDICNLIHFRRHGIWRWLCCWSHCRELSRLLGVWDHDKKRLETLFAVCKMLFPSRRRQLPPSAWHSKQYKQANWICSNWYEMILHINHTRTAKKHTHTHTHTHTHICTFNTLGRYCTRDSTEKWGLRDLGEGRL